MDFKYGKIIFRIKTGSTLYGLNTPESDEDYMSVFIPNTEYILGLKKINEIDLSTNKSNNRNTVSDIDDKYYSIDKYLKLLLDNNPNIIETLFVNDKNIIIDSKEYLFLRNNYKKIVNAVVYKKFTGYAYSQRKKLMVKKERYTSLVEGVTVLEDKFGSMFGQKYPLTEEDSDILNKTLKYYKGKKNNTESFHKGMDLDMIISKLISERDRYGWRVNTSTFETLGYDIKFCYHIIRLLGEGEMLLRTNKITFPLVGKLKDDIMRIRNGLVSYEDVLIMIDEYEAKCQKANNHTKLRKTPDFKWANDWLINILKKSIIEE